MFVLRKCLSIPHPFLSNTNHWLIMEQASVAITNITRKYLYVKCNSYWIEPSFLTALTWTEPDDSTQKISGNIDLAHDLFLPQFLFQMIVPPTQSEDGQGTAHGPAPTRKHHYRQSDRSGHKSSRRNRPGANDVSNVKFSVLSFVAKNMHWCCLSAHLCDDEM